MRMSSRAVHALRWVASQRPKPSASASWYRINVHKRKRVNQADSTGERVAEVSLLDEIGIWGITAGDFIGELNALDVDRINLQVHSLGGDYDDGLAIYSALQQHPAQVDVTVLGTAASAASFIAMAGDSITMHPHAEMMIHDAWGCGIGNADEVRSVANMLEKSSDNIASIYSEAAERRQRQEALSKDQFRALMKEETWYSPQEAIEVGLADDIWSSFEDTDGSSSEDEPAGMLGVAQSIDSLVAPLAAELGFSYDPATRSLTPASDSGNLNTGDKLDDSTDEPGEVKVDNSDDPSYTDYIRQQVRDLLSHV